MEPNIPTREIFLEAASNEIVDAVRDEGIFVFDDPVLNEEQISKLIEIADEQFLTGDAEYKFGVASRVGELREWNNTPVGEVFNTELFAAISTKFLGYPPQFSEIFFTHEYKMDEGLDRNGWLHFDRIHTLKFFLYLTECTEKNGPFSYVPGTHKLGKKLRLETQDKHYDEMINRLEVDHPELGYKTEDAVPIVGKAGTMFIFDTDLFHMGGVLKNECRLFPGIVGERKIMRLHIR